MDETQGIHRYHQTDLASTGPEKMIVRLYEAAQRHLQQARVATDRRDLAGRTQNLNAAQTIFMELRNALDHDIGGQLSRNLEALYDFLSQTCIEAIVDHQQRHLENALRVMRPLLDAWRRIPPGTAEKAARDLASELQPICYQSSSTPNDLPGPQTPDSKNYGLSVSA